MKTSRSRGTTPPRAAGKSKLTGHGRLAPPLVLILLWPVLGACRDSGQGSAASEPKGTASTSTVDADFISRAEAACAPYADYQATTFLDLRGFNRYVPDPALLPQVATYLAQNPAYQTLVSDLEGLGEPESGAAAWAAVVDDFRENALAVQAGIEAARSGDAARFADFAGRLEQDKTQLFTDLQVAGLGGSSCSAAEVDPLKGPPKSD